jgi:hypothetical protein
MGPAYGGALILLAANGSTEDTYHTFDGNGTRFYWEFDGSTVYFNHRDFVSPEPRPPTQSASVGISLATWYDYRLTLSGTTYKAEYKRSAASTWNLIMAGTIMDTFVGNTVGISSASTSTGGHRVDDISWSTTTSIAGHVDLQQRASGTDQSMVGVRVQLRTPGTQTPVQTVYTLLDSNGDYSVTLPSIAAGTYDVAVKAFSWLERVVPNVAVAVGSKMTVNVSLDNGDADGNNAKNSADMSVVLTNLDGKGDL